MSEKYEKTYLVGGPVDVETFDHEPNMHNVVQELYQRGLRPVGDVSFDDSEPDGKSLRMHYSVPVVDAGSEEDVAVVDKGAPMPEASGDDEPSVKVSRKK
jgi:hypothetical protein